MAEVSEPLPSGHGLSPVEADLDRPTSPALEALVTRFDGDLPPDDVLAAVQQAREEIEPGATVHDFLELLVERRARDILAARSGRGTESAPPHRGQ